MDKIAKTIKRLSGKSEERIHQEAYRENALRQLQCYRMFKRFAEDIKNKIPDNSIPTYLWAIWEGMNNYHGFKYQHRAAAAREAIALIIKEL